MTFLEISGWLVRYANLSELLVVQDVYVAIHVCQSAFVVDISSTLDWSPGFLWALHLNIDCKMAALAQQCPGHWAKKLKPFLLRSIEFESRQPVVAYNLKTYVAHEAMKMRKKDDKEGTAFLMTLLEHLEKEKTRLAEDIKNNDGRTALTRTALMLFSKADDLERTGAANEAIVKMFFASIQLFEATAQFTPDGNLDPIAAEKAKYAKYIAFKMKKALDSGVPYQSQNELELPDDAPIAPPSPTPSQQQQPQQPPTPPQQQHYYQPPPQQQPPSSQNSFGGQSNNNGGPPPYGFPQIPQSNDSYGSAEASYFQPPPPQQQQYQPPPSPPQQQQYQPPTPPQQQHYTPPPPQQQMSTRGSGGEPSMDDMIKAQKLAKQAVAALQFFDHANARSQLVAALNALDGR